MKLRSLLMRGLLLTALLGSAIALVASEDGEKKEPEKPVKTTPEKSPEDATKAEDLQTDKVLKEEKPLIDPKDEIDQQTAPKPPNTQKGKIFRPTEEVSEDYSVPFPTDI